MEKVGFLGTLAVAQIKQAENTTLISAYLYQSEMTYWGIKLLTCDKKFLSCHNGSGDELY